MSKLKTIKSLNKALHKNRKVLILYTSIGSGHKMAANAISEELRERGVDVKMENILNYSKINIEKITQNIAERSVQNQAVGYIYDFLWRQEQLINLTKKTISLLRSNFSDISTKIREYKPDAIICTQALAGLLSTNVLSETPVFAVITDFRVTSAWFESRFYHFFVANSISKIDLIKGSIPSTKISIEGIPLRKQFTLLSDLKVSKKHKKLNVFILADGLDKIKYFNSERELINTFLLLSKKFSTVVVCGSNSELYKKLSRHRQNSLKIVGECTEIATLINNSDVVVTKPGGLICAEAASLGKPMILIGEGYGQERGNVEYLTNIGAAIQIDKVKYLAAMIETLSKTTTLSDMSINSRKVGKPWAAKNISKIILKTIAK